MGGEPYFYDVSRSGCQGHPDASDQPLGFSEVEGTLGSPTLRSATMTLFATMANLMASIAQPTKPLYTTVCISHPRESSHAA